jgi:hypothetical protein
MAVAPTCSDGKSPGVLVDHLQASIGGGRADGPGSGNAVDADAGILCAPVEMERTRAEPIALAALAGGHVFWGMTLV